MAGSSKGDVVIVIDDDDVPNDVVVPNALQDVDLPTHTLHIGYLHDAILLQNFHPNLLPSNHVRPQLYFTECSLSHGLLVEDNFTATID